MSKRNKNRKPGATKAEGVFVQKKGIPGIMNCVFKHKVKAGETEHDFAWEGPTLNEIWPVVLAFLKWTNDTFHSESQLRLFVNYKTKKWKAWAFPQRARTGMSAKEITEGEEGYDKAKEQRAQFGDDWYYWGTVHHHCNSAAFQSGTDRDNEQSQDGIHITVGNMSSSMFDIHTRVYVGGFELGGIDMSDFWDVGDEYDKLPDNLKAMLVNNAEEILIKRQMCTPPPSDLKFPDVWRENIIEIKPPPQPVSTVVTSGSGYHGQSYFPNGITIRAYTEIAKNNFKLDLNRAMGHLDMVNLGRFNDLPTLIQALEWADKQLTPDMLNLLAICVRHDVLPGNLASHIIQEAIIKQKEDGNTKGPATKQQLLGHNVHGGTVWHGQDYMGD